jgi:hypothetical protein
MKEMTKQARIIKDRTLKNLKVDFEQWRSMRYFY